MKKSRLWLSSLCFALALTLTCIPTVQVHADEGPQGGSNSTKSAPPPPPPPPSQDLLKLLEWIINQII